MGVLILEDSANMRRILTPLLRSFGFEAFHYATNSQMALGLLRKGGIDLSIVDWPMKAQGGIDFARMVRAEKTSPDPYLPIILLSGFTDPERMRIARNMGVNEILAKPFSPEALYGRLTSIVRQPRPFFETGSYFGPDRRTGTAGVAVPYRRRRDKRWLSARKSDIA